jgi:hypothetical protein
VKKVFIYLLILSFGFVSGFFISKHYADKIPQAPVLETRLDTLIPLDTPQGILDIVVFKDSISFEPFENAASPYMSFSISKKDYPKLFEEGVANSSFISANVINDKATGKTLVVVSDNQPDHGAYSPTYQLTVDPLEGKVISQ